MFIGAGSLVAGFAAAGKVGGKLAAMVGFPAIGVGAAAGAGVEAAVGVELEFVAHAARARVRDPRRSELPKEKVFIF
jgi:hypothetical protein